VKFLIDAQLPRRLARWLQQAGHNALHTLDLAQGNRTPDAEIVRRANDEGRIVITKDADFVNSFTLAREPRKLLLISTGNISNAELNALLDANLFTIVQAFQTADFVELTSTAVVVHV
jgi:predicted nuclease of predicted toxin-antitoxin system